MLSVRVTGEAVGVDLVRVWEERMPLGMSGGRKRISTSEEDRAESAGGSTPLGAGG